MFGGPVVAVSEDVRDLRPTSKLVIMALQQAERPLTREEIADASLQSYSSASKAVSRLEERGYITSVENPTEPGKPRYSVVVRNGP